MTKSREGKPGTTEVDDEQAFLDAMQDVAPIGATTARPRKPASADTIAKQNRRDAAIGLTKDTVDPNFLTLGEVPLKLPLEDLIWKKDGVQNAVFSKLRKGGYELQANLDLHRKTVKEARAELFQFLARASAKDLRCLIVSPGKGEFSPTPARLKSYVAFWLESHPEVIAFCSAQRHHGGVGALYVLMRKSPHSRELNREQHGLQGTDQDDDSSH